MYLISIKDEVLIIYPQPVENILIAARDKLIREDLLILSCEEDYTTCVPFLEKGRDLSFILQFKMLMDDL